MKTKPFNSIVPVCLVVLVLTTVIWVNAGSLTPPAGPVTPTMKTLTDVEPRTAVQSLSGSGTALHVISQPGSYYLNDNITGVPGKNGIEIQADGVTLDLRGMAMIGVAGALDGVAVPAAHVNLAIRNGSAQGWSGSGINAANAGNSQLEQLRVSGNGQAGAQVGGNGTVLACTAQSNTGPGMVAGDGTTVWGCAAQANGGDGIRVSTNCRLVEASCTSNGSGVGSAGIHATGSGNRIEGNNVGGSNGNGMKIDVAGNLIVRNSVRSSTGANYNIAAGNDYAQILANPGANFTTTNTWANFSDQALATCTDGIKNGSETGVDCGGGTCPACPVGQGCNLGSDCQSGVCAGGTCQAASCTDGIKNGSETGVDCGGGTCPACPVGQGCNVGSDCQSGVCSAGTCQAGCPSGFADCNANPGDGCEVNINTNVNNCGSCGLVCPTRPNSIPGCTAGACTITCNAGYLNCNGNPTDGCEVNISSDVNNCGSCGLTCPTHPNSTPSCNAGACTNICNAGYADCDNNSANGCEINLVSDHNNCGACGVVCSGIQTCVNGTCQ